MGEGHQVYLVTGNDTEKIVGVPGFPDGRTINAPPAQLDERSHESHDNCHSVTLYDVTQLSHDSP
jgi:hypothetical protein